MSVTKVGFSVGAVCGALVIAALPLQAQQPAPHGVPVQTPELVVIGCLKAGPNPSGVPDSTTYTLEPIETAPAPRSAAAPAEAQIAKPKSGTRYTLTAPESVQLQAHVGHKVEISGHLKELDAPKTGETTERDPQAKPPAQPGGAHNTFEVASLRMVAPTCP